MKDICLYKFYYCIFIFSILFIFSCKDTDVVGLEVQPASDRIEISSSSFGQNDSLSSITISTESEDSLRSDETSSLLLGRIDDPIFGENIGVPLLLNYLLSESNIEFW